LSSCRELEREGIDVTYLPVGTDGIIDPVQLEEEIRPGETCLVSVMYVNNEIGVMQPMKEIGEICRKHKGVLFHTDAAQAIGKVPVNVDDMNIDMMSISGHKIYGPKGIGALYVRKKNPRVRIKAQIDGGGQEFGLRSGTLSPVLCVGLGAAIRVAGEEMERDEKHILRLSKVLWERLSNDLEAVALNGHLENRFQGNLNISFACVEGESLLMALAKTMSISSGSACTSASLEPSYVLRAIGVGDDLAHTSLRFGIGRFTTEKEINDACDEIVEVVNRLRDMSPLWDMYKDGDTSGVVWS
jgi:cysteine desulfurase